MNAPPAIAGFQQTHAHRSRGFTLVEAFLAMLIVSIAVLGLTHALIAGHQQLHHSDHHLRAVRLAEHLMEEIHSRPYVGNGAGRASYHLDDYDGFHEAAGNLKDFSGSLYDDDDQLFIRTVSVSHNSLNVADLDNFSPSGKTVTITLEDIRGTRWQLARFIPAPIAP